MHEHLLIITPGSLTTVQDQGRFGHQKLGVPQSGALDTYASRIANKLVGNSPQAAVLEMTVIGPTIAVLKKTTLAVTGAEAVLKVNGRQMESWKRFDVQPGDLLQIGQVRQGCRMYLAVAGGIDAPMVLGSRSTCTSAGFGGFQGRALHKGDFLAAGSDWNGFPKTALPESMIPAYDPDIILRCLPGPQEDFFQDPEAQFYAQSFSVSAQADRRGVRLEGPRIEHSHASPGGVISEPSLPGNIQVPGDGQPIVILVEQTVGGYAKIGTVISCDLWKLAQAIPGNSLRFQPVDLQTAHELASRQEKLLNTCLA